MFTSEAGERYITAIEFVEAIEEIAIFNELPELEVFTKALYTQEYKTWCELKRYVELPFIYRVNQLCKELKLNLPYKDELIGY